MDAAEFVVCEDERMALAALALDSLSDAVGDESILHLVATLDTEADLGLIVSMGERARLQALAGFLASGFVCLFVCTPARLGEPADCA